PRRPRAHATGGPRSRRPAWPPWPAAGRADHPVVGHRFARPVGQVNPWPATPCRCSFLNPQTARMAVTRFTQVPPGTSPAVLHAPPQRKLTPPAKFGCEGDTIVASLRGLAVRWGSDRQSLDLVLFDQAADQARFLGIFDEVGDVPGTLGGRLVAAHGLLHGTELSRQDGDARHLRDVLQEARPQAGQDVDLVVLELVEGAVETGDLDQLGVLEVVLQPQAIGRAG